MTALPVVSTGGGGSFRVRDPPSRSKARSHGTLCCAASSPSRQPRSYVITSTGLFRPPASRVFCDEVGGKANTGRGSTTHHASHLECAHYEKHGSDAVVPGWYEDVSRAGFDRRGHSSLQPQPANIVQLIESRTREYQDAGRELFPSPRFEIFLKRHSRRITFETTEEMASSTMRESAESRGDYYGVGRGLDTERSCNAPHLSDDGLST